MSTMIDYVQFMVFIIIFVPFILVPMMIACGTIKLACYAMGEGWVKVYISDGKYEDTYDCIF
jgi:hypothetical protein